MSDFWGFYELERRHIQRLYVLWLLSAARRNRARRRRELRHPYVAEVAMEAAVATQVAITPIEAAENALLAETLGRIAEASLDSDTCTLQKKRALFQKIKDLVNKATIKILLKQEGLD